ncbi:hemerythrin domain-containing protein [uncultured Methylibium sp.]|uniref:hemerythrin domain-containing protein n=1 Tax=uncultured Methylibium sp. TaxID=381093 RepID=UPI0025D06AD4|nr:hemerythrin domain-containing protein [uncultured Methylibium sp.]
MATKSPAKKTTSARTSKAASDANDPFEMLKSDHREVEKMHKAYEKLVESEADAEERGELAARICAALTVHATVEEEVFYPPVREAIDDDDIMDHADVEHESAKDLIAQIESMGPDDSHYDAKVTVLCEYVAHHVKEEEEEMFPKARKAKGIDFAALAQEMAARKAELEAEYAEMAS